jgi:hypothetical protein
MFIAALFTKAKLWKYPRCPTTDKWVKKMCYGILLSHKKNEILSFSRKWVEVDNIILSEVSQAQKDKSHMFSLMQTIDLKQMQQYYGTRVTLRGSLTREG